MADKGYFLSKADVRLLQDMARAHRAGKTSRRPTPQRRRNRGGGSGNISGIALSRAILYDKLGPAAITFSPSATDSGAVSVEPGENDDPEALSVLPLVMPTLKEVESKAPTAPEIQDFEALVWPEGSLLGTPGTPMKMIGLNYAWETYIPATDSLFRVVEGFYYKIEPPGGEPEDAYYVYAVLDVVTPFARFVATADAAVSGATFNATPVTQITGKMPAASVSVLNHLEWNVDSGGKVLVDEGVSESGDTIYIAYNAECPA